MVKKIAKKWSKNSQKMVKKIAKKMVKNLEVSKNTFLMESHWKFSITESTSCFQNGKWLKTLHPGPCTQKSQKIERP
jgi:hypothetical protein